MILTISRCSLIIINDTNCIKLFCAAAFVFSTSESSIGKVQQMHQELDKHKYSRLQRVTMTLQSASVRNKSLR